ncbi:MAG: hypothetical protein WKF30_12260 [Pyrinomonadaceae bacterium]
MKRLTEQQALAQMQSVKAAYKSHIIKVYEPAALACKSCPNAGVCCTDAHFVNVHITRLEAIAMRETLERTPRLTHDERRAIYRRAAATVARHNLRLHGDTFQQTYSCPLFEPGVGCVVHRRAKPAPCIQHACYDNWEDVPPLALQWRTEHRIEQLNRQVYGSSWAWPPTPLWLTLVDPEDEGRALGEHAGEWSKARPAAQKVLRSLPGSIRKSER